MTCSGSFHPTRRRWSWIVLALLCVALFSGSARAALIGDAAVPYSASRTVISDGKTYVGRMWSAPGMQRHEQTINGVRMIVILRADRHLLWLIAPDFKVYTALPLPDTLIRYADRRELGAPVGAEPVGGVPARKYRIRHRDQTGAEADGWLWMDRDGIVRKISGLYTTANGRKTPVTIFLSDLRTGAQDPDLFEVPPDMQMLPPQAVAPLLGLRLQ
jgi:hypothetical protein